MNISIDMLFFRRRDTSSQSNLTDQERCIHACLFFAFVLLTLTIIFFYLAATSKGNTEQRLYYYVGASISLGFLLLITLCTVVYIRRFYGFSASTSSRREVNGESDYDRSKYSNSYA